MPFEGFLFHKPPITYYFHSASSYLFFFFLTRHARNFIGQIIVLLGNSKTTTTKCIFIPGTCVTKTRILLFIYSRYLLTISFLII